MEQGRLVGGRESETGRLSESVVEVERNVTSLGFFTPSRSRGKVDSREKRITFRREENGTVVETTARILPSAKYGLPTTADQDKFLAFQKIISDMRLREGRVQNPVGFTSKQLLEILGLKDAGNNYQDIYEWMDRMTATTIHSNGVVYLADRKMWASNTFHVFDQVVRFGSMMSDGRIADRNYVWLSEWQLSNINNNYLIPVDFESYRKLRGSIAKAMVPLLQVWLYASRNRGRFEKRYGDLCEILDIKRENHRAHIRKQLGPSLDELAALGYLRNWSIELTQDGQDFKLVAEHGPKFAGVGGTEGAAESTNNDREPSGILAELLARGVTERTARKLLREISPAQPVQAQIRWIDHLVASSPQIKNPPGFYVSLLRDNVPIPSRFLTQLGDLQAAANRSDTQARDLAQELLYDRYRRHAIETWVDAHINPDEWRQVLAEHLARVRKQYPNLVEASQRELAAGFARASYADRVPLMSLQEFLCSKQLALFEDAWRKELHYALSDGRSEPTAGVSQG